MSSLLRCTSCTKDMVIEAFHAGRNVPCPWCRASNDVPREIDFTTLARSQVSDESSGGWLLAGACLSFIVPVLLLPLAAWIWWYSHGRLTRADDEGRPGDAMVKAARWISIGACVWQGISASLIAVKSIW